VTTDEFAIAFRTDPIAALTAQGYAAVAAEISRELESVAAVTDAFAKRLVGSDAALEISRKTA
jgi:hypothetical protein